MKHTLLSLLLLSLSSLSAANLIVDSDCNNELKTGEFSISEGGQEAKLSVFVEDLTWNRCLKLELLKYTVSKDGKRSVCSGVRMGGTSKIPGFVCKSDTTYRFSLEVKGGCFTGNAQLL